VALPGFFNGTEMPTAGWWGALWPDPAAVVARIGIAAGMEVVDLCCGDGWFTLPIAKIARHVTAIDIDRRMLDAARARLAQHGVADCGFVEGDAYDIDRLIAWPADFVFLANAFSGRAGQDAPRSRCCKCAWPARAFRDRQLARAAA
jgi:SAM-dependent methyltransferase